ncbi:MAG: methyltransferase domain-containing protein [Lachnospiraceae bacterium]|nr:methyltransferase domain-containing protein [Lachnospiraceae bacterium]
MHSNDKDKSEYLTSGQLASMAKVSVRTVRFYDTQNVLKPSVINPDTGARLYVRDDYLKLEQILVYKYLGFSLEEIKELMLKADDKDFMLDNMRLQKTLIEDKIEQMQLVKEAVEETLSAYEKNKKIDFDKMLRISELTAMENSLNTQYKNSGNISARINLHKKYSVNKTGWFPWLFKEIMSDLPVPQKSEKVGKKNGANENSGNINIADKNSGNMNDENINSSKTVRILEIGCGSGELWKENIKRIPDNVHIILSDISAGMVADAQNGIFSKAGSSRKEKTDNVFEFMVFDANDIPFEDLSVDVVIANHCLFYFDKTDRVLSEIKRVLKKGGILFSSTYGSSHMKEITDLCKEFDERISLAAKDLYLNFGLENGEKILKKYFGDVKRYTYDDCLYVDKAEPLLEYILSCHGNQNKYITDRYKEFKSFTEKKVNKGFKITKEAGYFKSIK